MFWLASFMTKTYLSDKFPDNLSCKCFQLRFRKLVMYSGWINANLSISTMLMLYPSVEWDPALVYYKSCNWLVMNSIAGLSLPLPERRQPSFLSYMFRFSLASSELQRLRSCCQVRRFSSHQITQYLPSLHLPNLTLRAPVPITTLGANLMSRTSKEVWLRKMSTTCSNICTYVSKRRGNWVS